MCNQAILSTEYVEMWYLFFFTSRDSTYPINTYNETTMAKDLSEQSIVTTMNIITEQHHISSTESQHNTSSNTDPNKT